MLTLIYISTLIYTTFTQKLNINNESKNSNKLPICKSSAQLVQNELRIESNGCSKPEFFEIKGEEDFTYCCDRHDACYETCGIGRDYCEEEFSKCLSHLCDTVFNHNKECNEAAGMYTMGTGFFGEAAYQESQALYCECKEKDQTIEHYINLIDIFYKTYVPEKHDDFMKNTLPKYSSSIKKLIKIYYSLHKTYPQAISHIGTRVGKIPPVPPMMLGGKKTNVKEDM